MQGRAFKFCVILAMIATHSMSANPTQASAAPGNNQECSFTALSDGFHVSWDLDLDSEQYFTVERRAFNRYWWRTRTTETTFDDALAPKQASSMAYRVSIRTAQGRVLQRVECPLVSEDGDLNCVALETPDGYEIRSSTSWTGTDFVVRRRTTPDGPFYWRGRQDSAGANEATFFDALSPTGFAEYQVWSRKDDVIDWANPCKTTELDACLQRFDGDVPTDLVVPRLNSPLSEEAVADLGIEGPAYKSSDGKIYYVEHGVNGEAITRLDPSTSTVEIIGTFDSVWASKIVHIDSAGGVYLGQWGGGSRSSREVSSGVIAPTSRFDFNDRTSGSWAIAKLPDGRTLRVEGVVDSNFTGENTMESFAYDPFTGVSTPLQHLHDVYIQKVLTDGRIVGYSLDARDTVISAYDCGTPAN